MKKNNITNNMKSKCPIMFRLRISFRLFKSLIKLTLMDFIASSVFIIYELMY